MVSEKRQMLTPVSTEEYRVLAEWKGENCQLQLINPSSRAVHFNKIPIFTMDMPFSPETFVYGEGYNKLSQYSGSVRDLHMVGSFGDFQHYKLPVPEKFQQVYNMIRFAPEREKNLLMGFTSCNRFSGEFWFDEAQIQVILNLEGIEIQPKQTLELESFFMGEGSKTEVEQRFAEEIQRHHPMLKTAEIPTGWCSWLVYGPNVTEENIYNNLQAIKERGLELKYIQLDDGYQPYMGDWLSVTEDFTGGIQNLCEKIREEGFEPAIWVAPFIAEKSSEIFQKHPEWFVKDEKGQPLSSAEVSFGGWRRAPWYMLDATHPEVRIHLKQIFKTMRDVWRIKYFKLDANMWGALPFGYRYEQNRTCVEAYRMGMKAILEGAGEGSFVLGCNAPVWPSLGLVHGMRVTNDNARKFSTFTKIAKECFQRNWQHNRLWINDPDAVVQCNREIEVLDPSGKEVIADSGLSEDELRFNATYILASGGLVLSGDDVAELTERNTADLKKLLPPNGVAAVFEDETYSVGRIQRKEDQILCVFNYESTPSECVVHLEHMAEVMDFWTEKPLGTWKAGEHSIRLSGCSAQAFCLKEDGTTIRIEHKNREPSFIFSHMS